MVDLQRSVIDWVAVQPALTGVALFAGGLFCAVTGARFARFLVTVFAVALGSMLGLMLALVFTVSPGGMIAAIALAAGFAAIVWPLMMLVVVAGLGWGGIAAYLLQQLGFGGEAIMVAFGLGFVGGSILNVLNRGTMTVALTSIIGSGVMIVGFLGASNGLLPSFGGTLRTLAVTQPLTIPVLLGMLTVTTYSCQANSFKGDIITGTTSGAAA